MKYTVRLLFLGLSLLIGTLTASAQETAFKEAESAYTSEDYAKAIELYEGLLQSYGPSAEVYYNLGNAYYKDGKVASAILNYERALLQDPSDGDIRFNLQLARQMAVDKIEPVGEFFLSRWIEQIENLASVDAWARVAVFCFLLLIACLGLFFFGRRVYLKKIGFYVGLVALLMVLFCHLFAGAQQHRQDERRYAIVFAPTVTVKSSPDTSGTDLFVLHEGTKVAIKSKLGDWSEIEMEDGNVGWMPTKDITVI